MGGGFLHVPTLMFLASLDKNSAVPISLTLVLAGALAAFPEHYRSGNVDTRLAGFMALGAIFGSVAGVLFNLSIGQNLFQWLFAITIIIVSSKMLLDLINGQERDDSAGDIMCRPRIVAAIGLAVLAGTLACAFGIGGGLIFVPTMIYVLRRKTKLAAGTSTLIIIPTAIVGLVTYYLSGLGNFAPSLPTYVLLLVPVALVGAYVGSKFFAERLTGRHIKMLFISLSLLVAVSMIIMAL